MTTEERLKAWKEEAERRVEAFSKLKLPTDLESILLHENQRILTLIECITKEREILGAFRFWVDNHAWHDPECYAGQFRQGEPSPQGYRNLYGYGSKEKWFYGDDQPECSCGLTKILGLEDAL